MPPTPAGYSGTPLPKKLGIKPGQRIAFVRAPSSFPEALGELPADLSIGDSAEEGAGLDLVVFFTTSLDELRAGLGGLARAIAPAGMI